eukprot:355524-Chlamydomonas_euryale.AAC.42
MSTGQRETPVAGTPVGPHCGAANGQLHHMALADQVTKQGLCGSIAGGNFDASSISADVSPSYSTAHQFESVRICMYRRHIHQPWPGAKAVISCPTGAEASTRGFRWLEMGITGMADGEVKEGRQRWCWRSTACSRLASWAKGRLGCCMSSPGPEEVAKGSRPMVGWIFAIQCNQEVELEPRVHDTTPAVH